METDMTKMFKAVDDHYQMAMQYKYAYNTLQNFGQFRDKRIWKNFTYLIDWMEENFDKEKFFTIMGKSYDLEDEILYRIQKTDDQTKNDENETSKNGVSEAWLMSNIFRHVENPEKESNPIQKFSGVVEFTKLIKGQYDGEFEEWTPPKKDEKGNDAENRVPVDKIKIIVYKNKERRKEDERKYEEEHGWDEKWTTKKIDLLKEAPKSEEYARYIDFTKKWAELKRKSKIPGWYHFDPENPDMPGDDHNSVKAWDQAIFNFLKDQKWIKKTDEKDTNDKFKYEEQSKFVVDCTQLLGIGGEAVVIEKSVAEKVAGKVEDGREFEALKIIPIMKHNFEAGKVEEMEKRVDARHDSADPRKFLGAGRDNFGRGTHGSENDRVDFIQPAGPQEIKLTEKVALLQAQESHEMTDQDVELAENHGAQFRHESLMEYSNMQLDFIKVFNTKVFVMVIGELKRIVYLQLRCTHLMFYIYVA